LPIFYGVTLFVNLFSIIHDGPECKWINFEWFRISQWKHFKIFLDISSAIFERRSNLDGIDH
jgi:hypothetical protein